MKASISLWTITTNVDVRSSDFEVPTQLTETQTQALTTEQASKPNQTLALSFVVFLRSCLLSVCVLSNLNDHHRDTTFSSLGFVSNQTNTLSLPLVHTQARRLIWSLSHPIEEKPTLYSTASKPRVSTLIYEIIICKSRGKIGETNLQKQKSQQHRVNPCDYQILPDHNLSVLTILSSCRPSNRINILHVYSN